MTKIDTHTDTDTDVHTRPSPGWFPLVAAFVLMAVTWGGAVRAADAGEPGTTWSFTLTDPDGQAVPGARVTLRRIEPLEQRQRRWLSGQPDRLLEEATTGADGIAQLVFPAASHLQWRAEAPGFHPAVQWFQGSAVHGLPTRIPLLTDPGLELRVLGPEGRPVPGARVHRLHPLAGPPALTGDDGRARSTQPVVAGKTGHEQPVAYRVLPPNERADLAPSPWVDVEAAPGEPFRAEVVLAPARPHRLRVLDAAGQPAANVLVRLVNSGSPDPHHRLASEVPLALGDADGLVEVPRPLSGEALTLRLVGPGLDWATVELAPPADPEGTGATPASVRLRPPGELRLRVLDHRGGDPVPGARVLILPSFAARTGPDGELTVRWPSPTRHPYGRETILVSAAGFMDATLSPAHFPEATDGTERTVHLTPLARLAGRVVDSEGRPVAGARLIMSIRDSPFSPGLFASRTHSSGDRTTGPDGGFEIIGPPPHLTLSLRVEAAGHAPAEVAVQAVEAGESRSGIEIVLPPGRRARASVLGPNGAPVPGATLDVAPHGPGQGDLVRSAPIHCDADGTCTVTGLSAGRFDLRATAPGHAATRRRGVEVTGDGGTGAPVDFGTLYLEPEAVIAGRVSAGGSPLPGVRVWATRGRGDDGDDPLPETRSGDDGRFSLGGLVAGARVHVHAHLEGHPPVVAPSVEAPKDDLELGVPPGAEVRGQVVDSTGAPVEGAWVAARPVFEPGSPYSPEVRQAATTGSDGTFHLEALPPGDLTLTGHQGTLHSDTAVRLEPGERLGGVRIVLEAGEEVRVVGRVTDGDGLPLAGAHVHLSARQPNGSQGGVSTNTRSDGTFSFDSSTEGAPTAGGPMTYELQVDHPGYLEHRRPLGTAGDLAALGSETSPLAIVLAEGGTTVSGILVGEGGEPVAGATLILEIPTRPGMRVGFRSDRSHISMSRPDGTFEFRDVEPGRWVLNAQHPAWVDAALDEPVEVGTAPVDDLRLTLERGATLLVRVTGLEPRELAGVRLKAQPQGDSRGFFGLQGRPDHEGVARLAGAWPGEWRLTVNVGDDSRLRYVPVTVAGGEREVPVEIDFGSGARLSGELWVNGEPRQGARLTLSGDNLWLHTVTGPEGRFSFPEVADGEYRLTSTWPQLERGLTVTGPRHLRLDLETGTVAGRVVGGTGEPVRAKVELISLGEPPSGGRRHPTVSQSGRASFHFEVPPGLYGLRVSAPGHQTREFQVQAGPGLETGDMAVTLPAVATGTPAS